MGPSPPPFTRHLTLLVPAVAPGLTVAAGSVPGRLAKAPDPADLLEACGVKPSTVCRWTLEQSSSVGWAKAVDFLVSKPLRILLILVVAYVLNRLVRRAIKRFAGRVTRSVQGGKLRNLADNLADMAPSMLMATGEVNLRSDARAKTLVAVLRSLSTAVIYTFAAIYVLAALGLQLGPLIAGAGIAGVALGFGAQSLVRDFLSGMFILVEDQYGVGDVIDISGTSGTVEEVTLRTTRLRDVNGTVWHVPNGEVRKVGNKSQQWARAVLDVNLPMDVDVDAAEAIMLRVAAEVCAEADITHDVLEPPEIWGVEDVTPDGITDRLVVKTTPGGQFLVMRRLRARLLSAFDEAGVSLAGDPGTLYVRRDMAAGQAEEAAAAATAAAKAATSGSSATPR